MGDNSPSSLDARYWSEPVHVTREQLLGRALFIYFPHSWNRPVPFFPDFNRMQFIRCSRFFRRPTHGGVLPHADPRSDGPG